jgi:hypothetical protein
METQDFYNFFNNWTLQLGVHNVFLLSGSFLQVGFA